MLSKYVPSVPDSSRPLPRWSACAYRVTPLSSLMIAWSPPGRLNAVTSATCPCQKIRPSPAGSHMISPGHVCDATRPSASKVEVVLFTVHVPVRVPAVGVRPVVGHIPIAVVGRRRPRQRHHLVRLRRIPRLERPAPVLGDIP